MFMDFFFFFVLRNVGFCVCCFQMKPLTETWNVFGGNLLICFIVKSKNEKINLAGKYKAAARNCPAKLNSINGGVSR